MSLLTKIIRIIPMILIESDNREASLLWQDCREPQVLVHSRSARQLIHRSARAGERFPAR